MGLLRMAARTAVVAGTATAVSNRVSRRQANRWESKEEEQAAAQGGYPPQDQGQYPPQDQGQYPPQQQYAPPPPAPAPEAAPEDSDVAKLQQLAQLHSQGVLSDEEFAAAKAKVLGI
jgi:putative oligomerization/nucleic acid binding protein/uncharacterized protein DUF3824